MKIDRLKQFVTLRASLEKERAALLNRLGEIDKVLRIASAAPGFASSRPARPSGRRGPRGGNSISLKEAILRVTRARPLPKREILDAIGKLGYKFQSKNPMNSMSVLLYTDKAFKNYGGKFGPAR
jgi:hypothetical protein